MWETPTSLDLGAAAAGVPLLALFASGYLVFRLLDVNRLTSLYLERLTRRARGRTGRFLFTILVHTCALSLFIPNVVATLTVVPLVREVLVRDSRPGGPSPLGTPLALLVIYGANIGGMASLIGNPGNLLFLGALEVFEVPGRAGISFGNWFAWSLPLLAVLVPAAWAVAWFGATPAAVRRSNPVLFPEPGGPQGAGRPALHQRRALTAFAAFLGFWFLESLLRGTGVLSRAMDAWISLIFLALFAGLLVVSPDKDAGRPLVPAREIIRGIPVRGVVVLGLLGVVILVVSFTSLDTQIARSLDIVFPSGAGPRMGLLALALVVILFTEFLSNTAVAVAFFPVAARMAAGLGLAPMTAMLTVTTASCLSFATPVATPCNALAFGMIPGVRLRRMMACGLVMNLIAAAALGLWLPLAIPRLYG